MKSLQDQIADKCIHFNGTINGCCDVGIAYSTVIDNTKEGRSRLACCREGADILCASREFRTKVEVTQLVDEMAAEMEKQLKAVAAAKKNAAEKGFKKGTGGQGECDCPACGSGKIRYSVAAINGHMLARCTTDECVAWME